VREGDDPEEVEESSTDEGTMQEVTDGEGISPRHRRSEFKLEPFPDMKIKNDLDEESGDGSMIEFGSESGEVLAIESEEEENNGMLAIGTEDDDDVGKGDDEDEASFVSINSMKLASNLNRTYSHDPTCYTAGVGEDSFFEGEADFPDDAMMSEEGEGEASSSTEEASFEDADDDQLEWGETIPVETESRRPDNRPVANKIAKPPDAESRVLPPKTPTAHTPTREAPHTPAEASPYTSKHINTPRKRFRDSRNATRPQPNPNPNP